jgi:hypothetical protein
LAPPTFGATRKAVAPSFSIAFCTALISAPSDPSAYARQNEQLQQQNALLQAAQAKLNVQLATLARRCRAVEAEAAALRDRRVAREQATSPGFGA